MEGTSGGPWKKRLQRRMVKPRGHSPIPSSCLSLSGDVCPQQLVGGPHDSKALHLTHCLMYSFKPADA